MKNDLKNDLLEGIDISEWTPEMVEFFEKWVLEEESAANLARSGNYEQALEVLEELWHKCVDAKQDEMANLTKDIKEAVIRML